MSSKPINLTGVPLAEARRMMAAQRPKTASKATPTAAHLIEQIQRLADAQACDFTDKAFALIDEGIAAGWLVKAGPS